MKIGYYIHHTSISAGGIFTYSIGVLRELIKSTEIKKITIITSIEIANKLEEFNKLEKINIRIVDRKNFKTNLMILIWFSLYLLAQFFSLIFPNKKVFNGAKKFISRINPYHKILKMEKINVFHIPIQYSPIYNADIPIVVTMHDLQQYHFPKYFSYKERLQRSINKTIAIMDSDHIIVSFKHVKDDIIKYFKIHPSKISICPPPFAENWFLQKNESDWEVVKNKFKLEKKYILYPAATWQHKNHLILLKAFKSIRDEGFDFELLCTGNKTSYYEKVLTREIKKLNLSKAVYFLGIVSENELISLYKHTSLVVIPTLYEAGSGPLYEAMRYKAPVICSNITSLPSTIKDNEFVFNPKDLDDLIKKIKLGIMDENYIKRNTENSKMRMDYYRQISYFKNFILTYQKIN